MNIKQKIEEPSVTRCYRLFRAIGKTRVNSGVLDKL